jgi:ankyrin repeat protein
MSGLINVVGLRECLEEGDVEAVNDFLAVGSGTAELVRAVVNDPIDADDARLYLGVAAQANQLEAVQRLIALGAEVNGRDAAGFTALLHALNAGSLETARVLLVQHNADANIASRRDLSPLLVCVYLKNADMLRLLLQKGATIGAARLFNPLLMAAQAGWLEGVKLLDETGEESAGMAVEHPEQGVLSPLLLALAGQGGAKHLAVAQHLVSLGVAPNRRLARSPYFVSVFWSCPFLVMGRVHSSRSGLCCVSVVSAPLGLCRAHSS